jgi:hypothetical protein
MSSDPQALLTVLLAMTGLTQNEPAALVGVASRTMRRWMEGVCKPPAVAIDRLAALALAQGQVADSIERRPDVQFVTYHRGAYRRWLGSRADSEALRTDWAASRLSPSSISG